VARKALTGGASPAARGLRGERGARISARLEGSAPLARVVQTTGGMSQPPPSSTSQAKPRSIILAAVDATPLAEQVIQSAVELASARQGSLHVAHVVDSIPVAAATVGGSPLGVPSALQLMGEARKWLERLLNEGQLGGVDTVGHLMVGPPQRQILQLASDLGADVLVVGTHDPGKLARLFLGSVAESLVRKAPCPVLVVRPRRESHPDVPEILPPCPECVATRTATAGAQLWCERHSRHHPSIHTYNETADSFAVGSMTFRPE
jgi:nucleotide-binding universal stress UspA family protein